MTILLSLLLFSLFLQTSEPVDPVALEWFHKGEELIGTDQEDSRQQAEFFEKAVELAPDLAVARFNLALVYIRQERPRLALVQLDELIKPILVATCFVPDCDLKPISWTRLPLIWIEPLN